MGRKKLKRRGKRRARADVAAQLSRDEDRAFKELADEAERIIQRDNVISGLSVATDATKGAGPPHPVRPELHSGVPGPGVGDFCCHVRVATSIP